jgi:trehalose-6-phosphatase
MTEALTDSICAGDRPKPSAVFFDFDRTLAEFAERPDLVRLAGEIWRDIDRIAEAVGSALVIITDRDLGVLIAFCRPRSFRSLLCAAWRGAQSRALCTTDRSMAKPSKCSRKGLRRLS